MNDAIVDTAVLTETGMSDQVKLLKHPYDRFNARDMESVLAVLDPDVARAMAWKEGTFTAAPEYAATGHASGRWSIRTSSLSRSLAGPTVR